MGLGYLKDLVPNLLAMLFAACGLRLGLTLAYELASIANLDSSGFLNELRNLSVSWGHCLTPGFGFLLLQTDLESKEMYILHRLEIAKIARFLSLLATEGGSVSKFSIGTACKLEKTRGARLRT